MNIDEVSRGTVIWEPLDQSTYIGRNGKYLEEKTSSGGLLLGNTVIDKENHINYVKVVKCYKDSDLCKVGEIWGVDISSEREFKLEGENRKLFVAFENALRFKVEMS